MAEAGRAVAALVLGRAALASLFVLGGIHKLVDPATSLARIDAAGLPLPVPVLLAVIAVELGGGTLVAVGGAVRGGRFVAPAAALLALHTVAVNVLFHPFWALAEPEAAVELSLFFKNVAVIGGLTMVAALHWPGAPARMA